MNISSIIPWHRLTLFNTTWFIASQPYLHHDSFQPLIFIVICFICGSPWFFFSLKKTIQKNVCTIVCVYWYKTHNYKTYIRVKNQTLWGDRGAVSKVLYVAANVAVSQSSVQLGLQDLSPRLGVQRHHLPANQLVRWPHVAVTSSQPVSLQPATSVVPHQGDLHAANTAEVLKHLKPPSQSVQQPLRVPSNTSDL